MFLRNLIAALATLLLLAAGRRAFAAPKDECLEAHGRGQDLRDKGQLSRARLAFTACAQSACPSVVQADCARLNEDLAHVLPTVTFVARDASAADLPATMVYVDDILVATRLDDGRSYEVDPGKHVLRYVHDGREATMKVVLNQGEKGRPLIATFAGAPVASVHAPPESFEPVLESRRSSLPLVFAGAGGAATIAGAVLLGLGLGRVPASCDVSTNQCATAAGDPALAEAASGVSLANTGIAVGIAGAAFLVGGVVWYLLQPSHVLERRRGELSVPYAVAF